MKEKNSNNPIIHIKSTSNNTIITLSSDKNKVLTWASSGVLGFKGARRSTSYAGQLVAERIISNLLEQNMNTVDINVSGFGEGRESSLRAFSSKKIFVNSITDVTPVAHGGCRPRKKRKI